MDLEAAQVMRGRRDRLQEEFVVHAALVSPDP
jgi:hypothetical protein